MVTVAEMRRRFDRVDIVDLTGDALLSNGKRIVDLNRQQMSEGIDSEGKRIGDYAPSTIAVKKAEGREWRFVTLEDEGDFKRGMEMNVIGDEFPIDSLDDKTSELVGRYGERIFGLTSENKRSAWIEFLRSFVVRDIKQITGAI